MKTGRHRIWSARNTCAFTSLEILAIILIIAIIITLALPSYTQLIANAGQAKCAANMRSITLALHGYLQDNQAIWPQGPSPSEELAWEQFWLGVLRPFGISDKTWQCPTFNTLAAASGAPAEDIPKIHYMPTMFSAVPNIANRWSTQPWLIERVSAHRHGAHICFPDGSVKSFTKILAEHGAR